MQTAAIASVKMAKPGNAAPSRNHAGHFGSRSISRPVRPCDGIAARSEATSSSAAAAAWSQGSAGSHSAACSQNGGWVFTSTIRADPTTTGARNHDDENRRVHHPASMKSVVETAGFASSAAN